MYNHIPVSYQTHQTEHFIKEALFLNVIIGSDQNNLHYIKSYNNKTTIKEL